MKYWQSAITRCRWKELHWLYILYFVLFSPGLPISVLMKLSWKVFSFCFQTVHSFPLMTSVLNAIRGESMILAVFTKDNYAKLSETFRDVSKVLQSSRLIK